jgi:hypothetical protein
MEIYARMSENENNTPEITPQVVEPQPLVKKKKKECVIFSKGFWDRVFVKIVEICISVKVWGLVSSMGVSTWLLISGYIAGGEWTTINTGIFATIYGVREAYKITRFNNTYEDNKE